MLLLSTLLSDIQELEVLWIGDIFVRILILILLLFLFVSGFEDVNKKNIFLRFFAFFYFFKVHLHHSSKTKVIKKSQNSRNQGFSFFCLILEGSGSRSKTNFLFYVGELSCFALLILGRCDGVCSEPTSSHWAAGQSFRVSLLSCPRANADTSGITVTRGENTGNKRRQLAPSLL